MEEELFYLQPGFDPAKLKVVDLRRILLKHGVEFNTNSKKQVLVDLFELYITPNAEQWLKDVSKLQVKDRSGTILEKPKSRPTSPVFSTPGKSMRVKDVVKNIELLSSDGENSPPRRRTRTPKDADYFSDENPFQSGDETPERPRRRTKTRRSTRHSLKRTESSPAPSPAPSPHRFMNPNFMKANMSVSYSPDIMTHLKSSRGAHDTPTSSAKGLPLPKRLRGTEAQAKRASKSYGIGPFWTFVWIVLLGYGVWYRQTSMKIGYCAEGHDDTEQPDIPYQFLYPECTPCPHHGHCESSKFLGCSDEFIPKTHPLTNLLFPLEIECVPDSAKISKIQALANHMKEELSARAGTVQCDPSIPENATFAHSIVYEPELKDILEQRKDIGMNLVELAELWKPAVRDLVSQRHHIQTGTDESGTAYFMSRQPTYPLGCRIKKKASEFLHKHLNELGGITLIVGLIWYIRHRYQDYANETKLAAELVDTVLNRLVDQEHYHYVDPVQHPTNVLSVSHLRDFLLSTEHNHVRRQRIWEKVRRIVEANSNVRAGKMEIKGEPHRVWEWVGTAPITPKVI
ncbi:hypothetical protein K493DRAFT_305969 [Basidiobolus meristosporus CBS 931.73]|uniref:Man1/Src1 C-terminal domain-containing protein n=1 Tax=Basidiobolus meristosporus CBS 931.73 TaxID=1314790 RepID=A0A1Y1XTT7_9FUNG|nr:hypothetical protein K493DRAFT_305969 [Basidiobolus meristosporus CBS 931.73]|eukprot:ORX89181.1 hypothetical protein K493DRAFT_305969 [Basidiobolus meristosporus CBS 931.73]